MSDIAQLGLSIDSRQATTAAVALDKLETAGTAAAASADKLTAAGARSETMLRVIDSMAKRAGVSFDEMAKRVDDASASVSQSASSSDKATTASTKATAATTKHGAAVKSTKEEISKFGEVSNVIHGRVEKLAEETGFFGQILSTVGPIGIAAAAGLGAFLIGTEQLTESANRMGELAIKLQNLSAVSGISTTALQALQSEAVGFGLSSTQTGQFLERFTQQLDGVRKGSGNLYAELLKIDPALLAQLSVTKDSTVALNLLAQAYTKAGTSQNALAAAAGGTRNGGPAGLLLGDIAAKGGVDGVTESVNQLDLITKEQVKSWAKLKIEIDDASSNAKNNIASIFTSAVLESEKAFYDTVLEISREMKSFALSDDFHKFMNFMSAAGTVFNQVRAMRSGMIAPTRAKAGIDLSTSDIGGGMTSGTWHAPGAEGPAAAASAVVASPAVQAQMAAAQVSFLGSAATATEKYNASVLKLNAEVAQNATLTGLQGRALAALGLDKAIAEQSSYVSALGALATTQDKVTLAGENFRKAQLTNSRLTNEQRASVMNLVAANDEWSRANQSAQLGVFNLGEATKAAGDLLKSWIAQGLLDPNNPEQYAAAVQVAANKVGALSDAAKVAGSNLPQLQAAMNDAGNFNKQLDQFATTSLTAVTPALRDMLLGTTSLSAGFKSLGMTIVQALTDAIIKIMVIKPLIDGLNSSMRSSGLLDFLSPTGADPGSSTNPLAGLTAADYGPGFATGGYTGSGGKYEPAGIVHRGEFVMNAAATNRIGVGNLTRLQGYADGGLVGGGTGGANNDSGPPVIMNDNRTINIGQGASDTAVAQLRQAFADDRAARYQETVAIVKKAKTSRALS
jgi:lambda family phage tail tape measure protein